MLETRFKQLKPNVRPATVKAYAASIRRLRKISPTLEYHAIAQYLKGLPPTHASNLLTSVIVLEGRERFGHLYESFIADSDAVRGSQTFSKNELANWSNSRAMKRGLERVKFDVGRLELLTVKKHKPHPLQTLVQYLVLKFYSEFHWRSDLVSIRLGKHVGKNYYHNGQFILNDFKTSRKFKARGLLPLIFTPSRSLAQLLRKYIEVRDKQELDHDYLIFNKSLQPIKRDTFYKFLTRATFKYVGKKLGTSRLRHIYITEFLSGNPTLRAKQKMLRSMQQLSLETFESYGRLHMPEDDDSEEVGLTVSKLKRS